MFLSHFDTLCNLLVNRRTATWNLFVLSNKETNYNRFFYFKIFHLYSKAGLCPLCWTRKKPYDVICCLYKMKQSHWLQCVAKSCDWSRKITSLSNLTQMASRGMNTWTAKSSSLKGNVGKIKAVFSHSCLVSRKAWIMPWILQVKENVRKLCGQH